MAGRYCIGVEERIFRPPIINIAAATKLAFQSTARRQRRQRRQPVRLGALISMKLLCLTLLSSLLSPSAAAFRTLRYGRHLTNRKMTRHDDLIEKERAKAGFRYVEGCRRFQHHVTCMSISPHVILSLKKSVQAYVSTWSSKSCCTRLCQSSKRFRSSRRILEGHSSLVRKGCAKFDCMLQYPSFS